MSKRSFRMNLWFSVLIILIIVGVLVWLVMRAPFIDSTWKEIIKYGALVVTVLWLLGLIVHHLRIPLW